MIQIAIQRKPGCEDLPLPSYMSEHASGMDLAAAVSEPVSLRPGATQLIPTGLFIAIPHGYEGQVRPRSGLALKHSITLPNAPGTIDADYRGELGVILTNLGPEPFIIERGMRIAQLIIAPVIQVKVNVVDELPSTDRGIGGFGHTGV